MDAHAHAPCCVQLAWRMQQAACSTWHAWMGLTRQLQHHEKGALLHVQLLLPACTTPTASSHTVSCTCISLIKLWQWPHGTQAAYNPVLRDRYAPYNMATAVIHWLDKNPSPKEQWVLVLDADMQIRHPMLPEGYNLTRGWAVAARVGYMKRVRAGWGGDVCCSRSA